MKQWFNRLELRERRVLIVGAIILVIIISYLGIYEPFSQSRAQLENIIAAQQETLHWMQASALEIQQLRNQTPSKNSPSNDTQISLLTIIDQSLKQSPLHLIDKRIEPQGESKVDISFEQVNFTESMRWLERLYNQHFIQIDKISIEKLDTPDNVKMRVTVYMP